MGAVSILLCSCGFLLSFDKYFLDVLGIISSSSISLHKGFSGSAGRLGLFHGCVFLGLKSSICRNQADQSLDHEAQEESKPGNIKVSLSSEESHVHLHLSIQMTHLAGLLVLLLT